MLDVNFFIKLINLSEKEDFLLKLYIKKNVTKEEVYHLLYDFDYNIEKEKLSFNFLLANIFQNNPNIEIPKDIKPRLQGVPRLFQYYNVSLLLGLKQLIVELNRKQIPVMLVKGSAMRLLESDKARMMYDVDCAVPEDRFKETIEISKKIGFKINATHWNATEIIKQDKQIIDVHHTLVKSNINSKEIYKQFFKRANKYNFYGTKVLIPNTEDFLFLLFNNGFDNIIYSQPFYKNVSWLLDGLYIIKNNININWNSVLQISKETGTFVQTKIMLELFNCFLPNVIPYDILSLINISEKEEKKFNFYTRTHLAFYKAQQLKIAIKKAGGFNKIKLIYQFLYLKIVQKMPVINSLFFDKTIDRIFKV